MSDQAQIALVSIPEKEYKAYQQLQSEVIFLRQQLADLKRMIFGSKSERFISATDSQLNMFSEPVQTVAVQATAVAPHTRRQQKQAPVRGLLPAHLPRVEEVIEPEELASESLKIGEAVTELLEYNPGKVYVRRIVRPKYKEADTENIVIGELPNLPIPKGNVGAGLLAHIQVSKWVDHLPYYRQVQIFKREGVHLSESTVNGWFTATCDLLKPLYDKLVELVKEQDYLQADESPIQVKENQKSNAKRTGYHWVYHAVEKGLVVFDYQPTRSRKGPQTFLEGFTGSLQTDGYAAYHHLPTIEQITLLACMAHARRYFEKALDNDKQRAEYGLGVIRQLYQIERKAKEECSDTKAIETLRNKEAIPILDNFKLWLDEQEKMVTPKSRIGKAIRYTLNLWDRLIRYTQNGAYKIDNNPIENIIRPLALGRKNYLFAGSNKAAQRAAMMYSFFATCKLHQVEPLAWLKDVLNRIPDHKINKILELLPHIWKPDI